MKPVVQKVKEAPRKEAIKKDHKVQPKVAKPAQKINKVHKRAVVQHPVFEKPKVIRSKHVLDHHHEDDHLDTGIKAQLKKLHDLHE
jgi:hypothetical protein